MGMTVTVAGPPTLIPAACQELGVKVSHRLEEAIAHADVVMMLRLQHERMLAGLIPSLREYSRVWGLSLDKLRHCRPDVLIMHPGPVNRGVELAPEVADSKYSVILDQVSNGVIVRMAVLYLLAGTRRMSLLLRNGRVVDPASGIDAVQDVYVADGRVITGKEPARSGRRDRG
jgi:aspartate carbamoyltransferase catalytic subunit